MAAARRFACDVPVQVFALESGGVRALGNTRDGPVLVPEATPWRVAAGAPDDGQLAALARAIVACPAPALSLSLGRLGPDGLAPLGALGHLERLSLDAAASFAVGGNRAPRLTNRELGYLYPLRGLRALSLRGGSLRMGSLAKLLRRMPALRELGLNGCLPPGTRFDLLRALPALRALAVQGPSEYGEHEDTLDDEGLGRVARIVALEELDLWRARRITEAGLGRLAALPRLRRLTCGDPDHGFHPGDGFVARLASFPALRALCLHTCGRTLTARGCADLAALPLEELALEACHLEPAGAALLAARFGPLVERPGGAHALRRPPDAADAP